MDRSNWGSQSTSSGSSSPSPRLVDNLRFYGEKEVDPAEYLGTKDVFKEVVKGRKSWKTLKGGEMVWPPELEAALLEGLASYQPDDSRETRLLGRFPMRNRYISTYIYQKTGKVRTAKQVGSRLQQLRDTCGTKKLQHLLSPCRKATGSGSPKSINYTSLQRYGLPAITNTWTTSNDATVPKSPISDGPDWSPKSMSSPMYISIFPNGSRTPAAIDKALYDSTTLSSLGAESHPRPIRKIDPRLTLCSYSPLDRSARSLFDVHDPHGLVIHTEESPLLLASTGNEREYYYSTALVPRFWETICNHSDPTEFTIEHKVIQDASLGPVPSILYSGVYKFCYPREIGTQSLSQFSPTDFDVLQDAPHRSPAAQDFHTSTPTSDHDIFDLSDLGLPNANTLDSSGYQTCGRSASVPNTPRLGSDKELYQSRRGSDPSLAWSFLNRSLL
ncbi:hypothetical protein V5O48_003869 [Marasmius crinis-equi]|uniref:TEA domain-containing protein n=1 Tax=Marasmius crinis-equi TaxID=585013 RepID=A0ABR3FRP4_9AGAR